VSNLLSGYQTQPSCHSGNITLIKSNKTGGELQFGGISRGMYTIDRAVIDLTGTHSVQSAGEVKAMNEAADEMFAGALSNSSHPQQYPWLRLPIKDYGVPNHLGAEFWEALANDILAMLKDGMKIIVFCQGGHGRTGMVASILCYLLNPKAIGPDPINWVREHYCKKAVETAEQVEYVHKMVGLPKPDTSLYIKPTVVYGANEALVGLYAGGSYKGRQSSSDSKLDTIANELYKMFVWYDLPDNSKYVLARRAGSGEEFRIIETSGTSDYVDENGLILSGSSLMTETEEKRWSEAKKQQADEQKAEEEQSA